MNRGEVLRLEELVLQESKSIPKFLSLLIRLQIREFVVWVNFKKIRLFSPNTVNMNTFEKGDK
jgi:hypothetical protein